MKKVAILGTGPAGLAAAHAAGVMGHMVQIFTQGGDDGPTKSRIGGAQFLHIPLPVINDPEPDAMLTYLTAGTTDGYREKVYGPDGDVPFVSMERIPKGGAVPAWSLIDTYDKLWDVYCSGTSVNVISLDPKRLIDIIERGNFDLVVSTIPKPALCLAHAGLVPEIHAFVSQRIRIANECVLPSPDNQIFYNGTPDVSWYRTSTIFGVGSTEWGAGAPERLPYRDLVSVKKPIRSDCTCFDGKVLFTGRFGLWRKGVLSHEGFIDTMEALK